MDNQWAIPHTDPQRRAQRHHVIPPTAERPDLNFEPNMPPPPQNANPDCPCQRCSDAQLSQPAWNPIEQRDPQRFNNAVTPYVNRDQGVDNPETTLIAPARSQAQFALSQIAGNQDNFGHVHGRAGPPSVELLQAPTLDASIAEGRRRLAGRYLNNPDAYVSMIRLEPGPSGGQSQVIIVVDNGQHPLRPRRKETKKPMVRIIHCIGMMIA